MRERIMQSNWTWMALCTLGVACSQSEPPAAPTTEECPAGQQQVVTIANVDREGEFRDPPAAPGALTAPSEAPVPEPGARITLAAQPDLNVEWLERLTKCEVQAYRDGLKPDSDIDPLAVDGTQVNVYQGTAGYVVELHAPGAEAAEEVYRRAVALQQQPESTWEVGP